ncbi:MAG: hypothetical protein R2762_05265 [Bryobacteraceae bacterium]
MARSTILGSALVLALSVPAVWAQSKYDGPRPPKADVPYLLHAASLIETEKGEAKEETRKDAVANVMAGASSPARTPLAEPIFLIATQKLSAERIELYRMDAGKNGREVVIPTNPKKRDKGPRPLRLSMRQLEPGLFRIEANEYLENGEYCLTPSGSQTVFCFQVY